VFVVAGSGIPCLNITGGRGPVCGDGGNATAALLSYPYGLALRSNGDLVIADENTNRIRLVSGSSGIISTILGNGSAWYGLDGVPGTASAISIPQGVAVDPASDDVFVADPEACVIRRIYLSGPFSGYVFNVAGVPGICGATVTSTAPRLALLGSIYFMLFRPSDGALIIADGTYSVVYQLPAAGNLTIVAGIPWKSSRPAISNPSTSPAAWFPEYGDGGPAVNATLNYASGLAFDALSGILFVTSANDNCVRAIDTSGTIWTVAGALGLHAAMPPFLLHTLVQHVGAGNGADTTGGDGGPVFGQSLG
jgi:trimeric autotransporter adhesin